MSPDRSEFARTELVYIGRALAFWFSLLVDSVSSFGNAFKAITPFHPSLVVSEDASKILVLSKQPTEAIHQIKQKIRSEARLRS